MSAIIRKELNSYFNSPIGYVYLGVFFFFAGLFFNNTALAYGSSDMRGLFGSLNTVLMFIIPLLTMRLFSEERRQKTDQALMTAPISLTSIVFGKFFAAFFMFLISISITIVFALILAVHTQPEWSVIFGHLVGFVLLGAALVAIGLFISALTESQVVAAIISFVAAFLLYLIDALAPTIPWEFMRNIMTSISFNVHYDDFTLGLLNFANIIYFLSVVAVFIFFTVRIIDRRRWN